MAVGEWTEIRITGTRLPPPRYEHAIAIVNRTLYVIGGNCSKSSAALKPWNNFLNIESCLLYSLLGNFWVALLNL